MSNLPKNPPLTSDELDKIFAEHLEVKGWSQDWDEAKAKLRDLLTKHRITELKDFFSNASHYPTDRAYEREPFYTITDSELQDRIKELESELRSEAE